MVVPFLNLPTTSYLFQNLPIQVDNSTSGLVASHLRTALQILEQNPNPTRTTDERDALIALLLCVLVERGTIPVLLKSAYIAEGNNIALDLPEFEFNKGLCDFVASQSLVILDYARTKKSVVKLQMTSPNSTLLFEILISNFGPQKFNVTCKNSALTARTFGSVYDMKKYLVPHELKTESNIELNYAALRQFSNTTKDDLVNPILNAWFQHNRLFTRMPYLLGIPEHCFIRITSHLSRKDRNNLRLTCHQIRRLSLRK